MEEPLSNVPSPLHPLLQHGVPVAPTEVRNLRAGPLELILAEGDVRYIRLGGREVVRRIYGAVRDGNWATVPGVISNLAIQQTTDSFSIRYTSEHRQQEVDFLWHADITGGADGSIRFAFSGIARSTFKRNRIGLCVLHPMRECAGARVKIQHALGTVSEGFFPKSILPSAPFKEIQTFSHEIEPGIWAEIEYDGETFEMEDQRNWSDASFKTFSTPLRLPFPVEVPIGTKFFQEIKLRLVDAQGQTILPDWAAAPAPSPIQIGYDPLLAQPLPQIGLGMASHQEPTTIRELELLSAIKPAHLRVDLRFDDSGWLGRLQMATTQADALQCGLEVALHLSPQAETELLSLTDLVKRRRIPVKRWLVYHIHEKSTAANWVRLARQILSSATPQAEFGLGSNANFTELNRNRPLAEGVNGLCFAINPQVHAFDNMSLVETLETQKEQILSSREFAGGGRIHISPVTFKPRLNAVAVSTEAPLSAGEWPVSADARQLSLFGACWTLGSIKYLSEGGASSVTFFETTGWSGVVERTSGSSNSTQFPSIPGMAFPLYHVLADIGELSGGESLRSWSSAPLVVEVLAVRHQGAVILWLCNFTDQPKSVRLPKDFVWQRRRVLAASSLMRAAATPEAFRADAWETGSGELVELPPTSVVRFQA